MKNHDLFCEKVKRYILQHEMMQEGDHVLVGVSGGADSLALLLVLKALAGELGIRLSVITVHHGIRGNSADEDVAFVKQLCEALNLPCFAVSVNVPELVAERGLSEEEAGRILRYQCYEEIGRAQGCSVLALAHHKDDQCETVLHHLMRGSSLRGLSGMAPVREQGSMKLVRPFLQSGRDEIEAWLMEKGQAWRTDETNFETTYTRNYIRHSLIPDMNEKGNLHASDHIVQAADDLREVQAYLEQEAEKWLEKMGCNSAMRCNARGDNDTAECIIKLPAEALLELSPVISREVLILAIRKICGGQLPQNIGRVHLQQIMSLCRGENNRWIRIPGSVYVSYSYGLLQLNHREEAVDSVAEDGVKAEAGEELKGTFLQVSEELQIYVTDPGLLKGLSFEMKTYNGEKIWSFPYTKCFKCDNMKGVLFLRTRQSGDYFILENGGRKSLKAYMIDQKIPVEERSGMPVLADGNHVWWVGDGRVSAATKVHPDSRKVLILREG